MAWEQHGMCKLAFTAATEVKVKVRVKHSRYKPELAWRVDRGIALPFCDLSARRSAPCPSHFTPRKDLLPIVQEAG
jgi:hypothetical protein